MAVTASLVFVGHNRLRYLLVSDDGTGAVTITSSGAATPDLQTDSVAGPVKNISKVVANGYGKLAAGGVTQAQARALLLSNGAVATVGQNVVTLVTRLDPATSYGWQVDVGVSSSSPIINISAISATGRCYLDIEAPGQKGV